MVNIMGYEIANMLEIIERISTTKKTIISTLNPHSYYIAMKDGLFRTALTESDFIIPDGIGIVIAAAVLNRVVIKKIAGDNIHHLLLNHLSQIHGTCFYLGSNNTTLDGIHERLKKEHPEIQAGFFSPPYKEDFSLAEDMEMVNRINVFNPDVLFVGMTAPKQEKWVNRNHIHLKTTIICNIGAVFDFYAQTKPRPNTIWVNLGLEWLIRLIREPRRMYKRVFISTPVFFWNMVKLFFNPNYHANKF